MHEWTVLQFPLSKDPNHFVLLPPFLSHTQLCKTMEEECLCSPLNWEFYYQQEGLEDLRYSFLQTTLELEAEILSTKEEITRRECELIRLNDALSRVIKERDESQAECKKLMLEKLELQQQLQQKQQILQIHEDESQGNPSKKQCCSEPSSSSSFECDRKDKIASEFAEIEKKKKPLPEKGKLLKAVIEAGPLLQTLLLSGGPLPQWQHPPPQLHSIDIPPLSISSPTPSPSPSPLPYKAPFL